ncbi:Gfo/Idh/MocA family oxidoreductase [Synechococcus sp. CS-1325]|uniref:Gfo/Idh/MocA family protein n=1 Tax=Synechococcus sp. CS-1325 TaxID=2847979 RepID=UPI000DB53AAF|nr:Gfo/Idh/MocA family oxidoreductase [Synechococcus sp. CS-1325]MCT0199673.1 Gfo/Idh/MocA family oxidoreductase [Synechococcus sp. CS-1325]PZV00312.1 MAG: oxidoreductase [Cyanobium sp.]
MNVASASSPPLKVAVAGLGFGAAVHLPALQACPNTEAVALWHPRPARLEAACRSSGLPGFSDFEALLADPSIEAVVIATPPAPRFALARTALAAGKHLMLEKPVCLHAEQILDLQRLAVTAGLSVAVDFEYRAVPMFLQLEALLAGGVIGEPWLVKLDWLMGSRADAGRPWSWYSQRQEGGGVLGALGTHAFDMLHWLIGPSTSVSASLSTAIASRPLADGSGAQGVVDADDIALLSIDLQAGTAGRVPAQLSLASVTRPGRGCWLELHGSKGALVLGSDNQADYVHGFQLWRSTGTASVQPVPVDPRFAFSRTWADGRIAPVARIHAAWSASVREGRPMVPGLGEGYHSQRCCDLALASAESGQRQSIT